MIDIDSPAAANKFSGFKNFRDPLDVVVTVPSVTLTPSEYRGYGNSAAMGNANSVSIILAKPGVLPWRLVNGFVIFNTPHYDFGPLQIWLSAFYDGANLNCTVGIGNQDPGNINVTGFDVVFRAQLYQAPF